MVEETEQIWAASQELGISMRTAAYVHALNRLGEARKAKGTRDYYINGRSA
jgi:glutamate dehydrogenase (NADP+)